MNLKRLCLFFLRRLHIVSSFAHLIDVFLFKSTTYVDSVYLSRSFVGTLLTVDDNKFTVIIPRSQQVLF